jgi:hypothetical protein
MAREPRINVNAWVGPMTTQPPQPPGGVQLMSQIGTIIFKGTPEGGSDPDWAPKLQAYVVQNSVELGNNCGAYIDSARQAGYTVNDDGSVTPPNTPPVVGKPSNPATISVPGKATDWLVLESEEIGVTVAGFAGKTSVSCQDNVPCYISTESTFPDDPNKTAYGAQVAGYIMVGAGQPYYYKHMGGIAKSMRTSVELV